MPNPTASHGGILYYVVKVPRETSSANCQVSGADATASPPTPSTQQHVTDSGWDNPFRPDGDLSREADEIVELIKGGKPITGAGAGRTSSANGPTSALASGPTDAADGPASPNRANNANSHGSPVLLATSAPLSSSTPQAAKNGANGKTPGSVDVQRNTLAAGEAAQVEHVTIKKKPRCTCCIIQ